MDALRRILANPSTERFVIGLIVVNAVILGLETSPAVMAVMGGFLTTLDHIILAIFVAELAARIAVHRLDFFKDPWGVFDFLVVAIALVPATGPLQVLRALRILRVLRLITVVPTLRRVVGGLLAALPGMGSIILLLCLIYYVSAVMATKLFGEAFPEWFGSIPASLYSLFQIMTLESWSMGIVRPVMEKFPYAWAFFVPFILCTTFTALNLFIGVVVSAMQEQIDEKREATVASAVERAEAPMLEEMRAMREEMARLSAQVAQMSARR